MWERCHPPERSDLNSTAVWLAVCLAQKEPHLPPGPVALRHSNIRFARQAAADATRNV